MNGHHNKERRLGRSLCPGPGYSTWQQKHIERLLPCLQVLARWGRKRELRVYDWCSRACSSAEARCAHTMSASSPPAVHTATPSLPPTSLLFLDRPVSGRSSVLSTSRMNESGYMQSNIFEKAELQFIDCRGLIFHLKKTC